MDNKGKGRELPLASPEPLVPVFQKSVNEKLADFLQDYFEDQPTKFKWGDVPKVKYLHVPDPNDPIELLEFTFRENDAEHTVNFTKRQMQTFGLTVEDFLNQKWGCPSIGISLDGEGVSCEWAPGAFQTTDGYGYWRIGEYGERFKCDKYGVKYPENIFDQDPFYDHVAVTVRPDTDNAKELFARIKSQDSKFVLESEAVLLSLKDENGKTICTQGKNRFFIAVEHEPSRMYIDECLRDAYAPNAKRIYNNCTPYNKTEIGYYQKGEHDERIACDISGKVGTTFGSTKTHPARDGTLIYADLTSYGHVLGYHRLGPLNEHIMCGKNGKTGTGLDQARIGRLALAYEMQKTLKDRRIQWTTEFHNLEFKGDYIDSVNALNHSQTVNFPGGQGAPPGPWNPKYNAPLNNFLWKRSDSEEYVIALADMAGDNHCCALSMLKKDNKTSVIYLEPFNATAGLPLRTLRTVASMIGQGAIHYAAAIIKAVQKTPAGCTDFAVDDTQVLETESVKQLFRKMHDNICTGKIIDPDAQYCHDKVSLFPKEEKYPALYALLSKYQEFNPEKEASLLFFQNGTYEVHQEKNVVTIQDEESLKDLRDVLKKRKLEYDFSYISSWKATIDKDEYDFVPGLAAEALPEGLISVRLESKFIPESIAGRAQNVFLVPYNADEPLHIACVERFNDGYLHKLPNSNGHLQVVEGDFLPPVFFNNTTSKTRREEYIRKNKKGASGI